MKKLVFALAAVALFAASCKKDYTCTCTSTVTGSSTSDKDVTVLKDVTKKQAKANCVSMDFKDDNGTVVQTETCELSK